MAPYQTGNVPADPRHSSRLGLRQRFYVVEVLVGLALIAKRDMLSATRSRTP